MKINSTIRAFSLTEKVWKTDFFPNSKKNPPSAVEKAMEIAFKVIITVPTLLIDPIYLIFRGFYNICTVGYVTKDTLQKRNHIKGIVTIIAASVVSITAILTIGSIFRSKIFAPQINAENQIKLYEYFSGKRPPLQLSDGTAPGA